MKSSGGMSPEKLRVSAPGFVKVIGVSTTVTIGCFLSQLRGKSQIESVRI